MEQGSNLWPFHWQADLPPGESNNWLFYMNPVPHKLVIIADLFQMFVCLLFVDSFGFFYIDHVICKRRLYFFLPNLYIVYAPPFFFCLVALVRTSSMMLKMGGEKEHPCLAPDLSEKL